MPERDAGRHCNNINIKVFYIGVTYDKHFFSPTQLYLVLDVTNLTNEEMDFEYALGKHILIESKESCRVPVPLERCPFSAPPTRLRDDGMCQLQRFLLSDAIGLYLRQMILLRYRTSR